MSDEGSLWGIVLDFCLPPVMLGCEGWFVQGVHRASLPMVCLATVSRNDDFFKIASCGRPMAYKKYQTTAFTLYMK